EGRPRPDDGPAGGALSRLRLGAQPGLRDPGPPRRHPRPRADTVPPALLPCPPADAGRRPARLRPPRRPERRIRGDGRDPRTRGPPGDGRLRRPPPAPPRPPGGRRRALRRARALDGGAARRATMGPAHIV